MAETGRRLRADAQRNRDLVLATARELLAEGGVAVSFDEIAKQAGIGVGTVYRHFPTREALFETVILGRIEGFVTEAQTLADHPDPDAALRDYLTALVDQLSLNLALCEALDTGFAAPEPVQHAFSAALGTLLRRAREAGAVRSDLDVADLLDLAIGCVTSERRARQRTQPHRLTTILLDGLRAR